MRSHQLAALALAAGACAVLVAVAFLPWWTALSERLDAVDDQRFRLERIRGVVAGASRIAASADAAEARLESVTGLVRAPVRGRAEAAVNAVVTTTLRQSGGTPRSIRVAPTSEAGLEGSGDSVPSYLLLSAMLDGELSNKALLGWMQRLATHPARPVVTALSVRAPPGRGGSTRAPRALRVAATVRFLVIVDHDTGSQP